MATKESQISYQADVGTDCLNQLVAEFGDNLERLTAIDKLDLLAILAFWQSADTSRMESAMEPVSLEEYLDLNLELQDATSENLDEALKILWLSGCSEGDAMALMVAIPQQLRDGVFQQ